ncbi:MAG TPA: PRC-barrel domain-containing protein [Micromonosporaceae bacterium]|nr:PRC-barrel domain-containing protein [Micromonosporaceae bacterium]
MGDLGAPIAYLTLDPGTPVLDRDGVQAGVVEHVLADEATGVFHGLIVRTPGDRHLFADREQVEALYERGVRLAAPGDALREPSEDAVAEEAARADENPVAEGLRRAWEWLSQPR